ncbi:acyltransferase [Planomicrobium sp. MB-3u-38]|uniref:acyltransferase n=1 Tax=Planomicrobium sp. MB-3u-38 TaxID=2058318 RepID=UPI000C7DEA2B|nr:acyltransferase [Planomicrobium sp. MB-3u-38]PKH09870.1 acyltransferase [Planomicrobium sp. MB-3u-38]
MEFKKSLKKKIKNNYGLWKTASFLQHGLPKNTKIIKGSNNKFINEKAFLRNVRIDIVGDSNEVVVKKGAKISNVTIFMRGTGHKLIIGEECIIKSGELWFEDENCLISIGADTTIENAHIAVTEPNSKIEIGNDCMISSSVDIRNGDSHSILDLETNKRLNYAKDIRIEDHVWIGAHVEILKGVNIGSNSIIGIRSLVTKDVPVNSIATGLPAKVVKESITWDRKRIYE